MHNALRELPMIPYIEMHSALREQQTIPYFEIHSALRELPTIHYIEIQYPQGTTINSLLNCLCPNCVFQLGLTLKTE